MTRISMLTLPASHRIVGTMPNKQADGLSASESLLLTACLGPLRVAAYHD